jgi:hypothetical protein
LPERLSELVAGRASRRGFLAKLGWSLTGAAVGSGLGATLRPGEADAFHFCGHAYTTGGCPHPTGLPRVDARGYPLRASDGHPVDDLGRPIDRHGRPLDEQGRLLVDPDGRPLPPASRTKLCAAAGERYGFKPYNDGAWYRCCGGHVRKLLDCCGYTSRRINGDAALTGYCYAGRKVFCTQYYQTKVPC